MSLGDDLDKEVKKILREVWTSRKGQVVPESDDIKLGNDAVLLDGTVMQIWINQPALSTVTNQNLLLKFTSHIFIALQKSFAPKVVRLPHMTVTGLWLCL